MGRAIKLEPHHIEAIVTAGLFKNAGKVSAEALAGHYAFLPAPPSAKPETVPSRAGDRLGYSGKRFEFLARQLVAVMKDGDPMFGAVSLAYQLSPEQRVAGVMCRALSRNLALDLAGEGAKRAAGVARKATTHLLQRTSTQDLERMQFETVTEEHAQSAEDFGLEFSTGRERSRVPGIDPPPPEVCDLGHARLGRKRLQVRCREHRFVPECGDKERIARAAETLVTCVFLIILNTRKMGDSARWPERPQ